MSYDSIAIRLRSADSHRNFSWIKITIEEFSFQRDGTEALLNMIRDGSYESWFAEFLRNHSKSVEKDKFAQMKTCTDGWLMYRPLFQKELTPSDVGKLKRLVIAKRFAVKYFPPISESEHAENDKVDDALLVLHDRSMRFWKYRYCYWKSSRSFVFSRGWNRYAKDNQLKANDIIAFYLCELRENATVTKSFCMIDIKKDESSGALAEVSNQCVDLHIDMQLQLGQNFVHDQSENKFEEEDNGNKLETAEEGELTGRSPTSDCKKKYFMLFGVEIF